MLFWDVFVLEEIEFSADGIIKPADVNVELNPSGLGHELFCVMRKNRNKLAQVCFFFFNIVNTKTTFSH